MRTAQKDASRTENHLNQLKARVELGLGTKILAHFAGVSHPTEFPGVHENGQICGEGEEAVTPLVTAGLP